MDNARVPASIPAAVKWTFTAFMLVLVPVYTVNYGLTNFLYFCDAALFLTLYAVWTGNRLAVSMAAVGILLPQFFWCLDFAFELAGRPLSHMTSYMFDSQRSLFLRGLSFFHGWLPFLLLFLLGRLGYDRRALPAWTALAWVLCLVSFFFLPPAGAQLPDPKTPVNVDFVWGLDDAKPQTWLPPGQYLVAWMLALLALIYVPTHFALNRLYGRRPATAPAAVEAAG